MHSLISSSTAGFIYLPLSLLRDVRILIIIIDALICIRRVCVCWLFFVAFILLLSFPGVGRARFTVIGPLFWFVVLGFVSHFSPEVSPGCGCSRATPTSKLRGTLNQAG